MGCSPSKSAPVQQEHSLQVRRNTSVRSFHDALLRERDAKHKFEDIYTVLENIGEGGLCTIYKIQKKANRIGGSSRPEHVAKRNIFGRYTTTTKSRSRSPSPHRKRRDSSSTSSTTSPGTKNGATIVKKLRKRDIRPLYFALKVINLALVKEDKIDQLQNEVEILKGLDHKNIIKAYETFQMKTSKKLMIVMELCTGGDLFTRMPYTETQVAKIMLQVLSAIGYLHTNNIAHRDIKLENILFESPHPDAAVKVIDFGLSKAYSPSNHVLTERVGTLYSMSPETLRGIYTAQADLWSIGVCAYIMLSGGEKPFEGKTPKQLVANILLANYKFEGEIWDTISDGAKSFLKSLLVVDPNERPNPAKALQDSWLQEYSKKDFAYSVAVPNEDLKQKVRDAIIRYADMGEFRKLALNVIAKKSSSDQIFELRRIFEEFDTLNTGTLTVQEFQSALSQSDFTEDDIMALFHKVDVNQTNVINYTEFLAAALETQGIIEEYRLAEAFDLMDTDDSGYISRENLREILGENRDEAYIDKLISEADFDKDGSISYQNFLRIFSQQHRNAIYSIYENDDEDTENDDNMLSVEEQDEVLHKFGILSQVRKRVNSAGSSLRIRESSR